MAKKISALYVDDASLRLVVTDGMRIQAWADLPLEPNLIKSNVVVNEAEVVAKIKQLFQTQKVTTKKVSVGISGLHCLTRPITLPQLPKEMLDEAVKREAQRALPVPLEQLYISWQTIPAPERKIQVFLTAIPRDTADSLLKALHQAGLEPGFMDIKPLLLARVVKEVTAGLVDVQTNDFDIAILTDGVPQPVRTIPFLDETLSWQEKLEMIKNELDRTITFYNSNNPENTLDASVPIFASGELADESELYQSLSEQLGHPVLPLPSPLEGREWFVPSRYMANIGLTVQKLSSGKVSGASVIDLNALPASYRLKPVSLTNILAPPVAAIATGLLAFLIVLTQGASADIASLRAQLDTNGQLLQQKLTQRQALVNSVVDLKNKVAELEASRADFTTALGSLREQSDGINSDLEATIDRLPDTISLSSVNHATSLLIISGRAPSESDILSYLMELNAYGRFSDINVTEISRISDEEMVFTLLGTPEKVAVGVSATEIAVGSLPASISVTSISSTDGALTIIGISPSEDEIISYLRALEASGKFSEIIIAKMTAIEGGGRDFSLVLKTGE
jgi:type IV pilus assembly protein PilM